MYTRLCIRCDITGTRTSAIQSGEQKALKCMHLKRHGVITNSEKKRLRARTHKGPHEIIDIHCLSLLLGSLSLALCVFCIFIVYCFCLLVALFCFFSLFVALILVLTFLWLSHFYIFYVSYFFLSNQHKQYNKSLAFCSVLQLQAFYTCPVKSWQRRRRSWPRRTRTRLDQRTSYSMRTNISSQGWSEGTWRSYFFNAFSWLFCLAFLCLRPCRS